MPVLQMPDGKLIRFPDDMPRAEIKARIAAAYPGAYAPEVEKKPRSHGPLFRGLRAWRCGH
jgi:hypothetical protein